MQLTAVNMTLEQGGWLTLHKPCSNRGFVFKVFWFIIYVFRLFALLCFSKIILLLVYINVQKYCFKQFDIKYFQDIFF